jgi:hypothetical protein
MEPDVVLVSLSAGAAAVMLERLRELESFRVLHERALERAVVEAGTAGRADVRLPLLELQRFADWLDLEVEQLHRHGGARTLLGLSREAPSPPGSIVNGETHRASDAGASTELAVGDAVELRDAPSDIVGTIVSVVRRGHVRVHWTTGDGYAGKTTMLSVRVLRKRPSS